MSFYQHVLQIQFSEIKIDTGDTYIGELPANKVAFELGYDAKTNEVVARARIVFDDPDLAKISGLVSFKAAIEQSINPSDCDRVNCYLNSVALDYRVNFGQENFIGKSSCLKFKCDLKSMSHNLVTSNTAKVFDSLLGVQIFNPILSMYLFSAISAGKKIGKGHEIIIN